MDQKKWIKMVGFRRQDFYDVGPTAEQEWKWRPENGKVRHDDLVEFNRYQIELDFEPVTFDEFLALINETDRQFCSYCYQTSGLS